jgi:hypothetical protein
LHDYTALYVRTWPHKYLRICHIHPNAIVE